MKFALLLSTIVLLFIAGAARAETIDVNDSHGGVVAEYNARWSGLAARGVNVRIVGPCQSACTVLLGHIPRSRICVMPEASSVSYTHLRAHETGRNLVCRLLL